MFPDREIRRAVSALRDAGEQRPAAPSLQMLRRRASRRQRVGVATLVVALGGVMWLAGEMDGRTNTRVDFGAENDPDALLEESEPARISDALARFVPGGPPAISRIVVGADAATSLLKVSPAGDVIAEQVLDVPPPAESLVQAPPHLEERGTVVAYDHQAHDTPLVQVRLSLDPDGEVVSSTRPDAGAHMVDKDGLMLDVSEVAKGPGLRMYVQSPGGKPVVVDPNHELQPLAPHPDGGFLVADPGYDTLRRVLANGDLVNAGVAWKHSAGSAAFSPTGLVAVGADSNTVVLVTPDGDVTQVTDLPRAAATALSFVDEGRGLLVTLSGRTVEASGVYMCPLTTLDCRRIAPYEPGQHAVAFERVRERRSRCEVGRVEGNFDGDGQSDLVILYAPRGSRATCEEARFTGQRRVAVLFADGRRYDQRVACSLREFRDFAIPEGCYAHGIGDLNDDGRDELFLNVGGGSAHGDFVAPYVVGSDGLQRIELAPPGNPTRSEPYRTGSIEFATAGAASMPTWIYCRRSAEGRVFVVMGGIAPLRRDRPWKIVEDWYIFDGEALHYERTRRFTSRSEYPTAPKTFCGHPHPGI